VATTIRQAYALTDAEKDRLFEWGDDIFGAESYNLRWRPKEVHLILDVNGEPASHVGLVKHEVAVAGRPVLVGGVGGVVTVPAWQKHGYARELMSHAVNFFAEWKVDAGLLFCMPHRVQFYESQGWSLVSDPVMIEQPEGEMVSPLLVMIIPVAGYRWPYGEVKLKSFPW
jgi:GNAT superfamily N-acetyltransferase